MAPRFLIFNLKKKGIVWNFVFNYLLLNDIKGGMHFLDGSEENLKAAADNFRLFATSFVMQMFLFLIAKPMEYLGYVVDFVLNFISQNGGLHGITNNVFQGKLVIPRRDKENFMSSIGEMDWRIDLLKSASSDEKANAKLSSRDIMDLCVMSSKLAYENAKVVQNVVSSHWKMNFVGFYDCWNEYQKESNTQLFIFSDKAKDADLIVVSFRGTEPFNAQDWSTDVDFSFYDVENVGKIHIGFLEAMGLGDRFNISSFADHLQRKSFFHLDAGSNSQSPPLEMTTKSAYYIVANQLCNLLKEHKSAKFIVTGHSLGGALAIMFPTVLVIQDETELLRRLLNVYTFGQPRIGDKQLGSFVGSHLNYPDDRYYRVVYCDDIVPRVPFDDKFFFYKHFGKCLYYDSLYFRQDLNEEPNPDYFGLKYFVPMRLNAAWELLRSFIADTIYGPDYKESWVSILYRVTGLLLPGPAAHSPVNYVNSVRLGRFVQLASLHSFINK